MTTGPADNPSNAGVAAMLWAESQRLLVRQEAVLDTLRTQAVALLSVGSIVAGLFGSRLIPGQHSIRVEWASGVALALFAVTAILTVVVLLPREWKFAHSITRRVSDLSSDHPPNPTSLALDWAEGFQEARKENQARLDRLMSCFWWACIAVGAQVIAWGIAVL